MDSQRPYAYAFISVAWAGVMAIGFPERCCAQAETKGVKPAAAAWDDTSSKKWPPAFQVVQIPSTADGTLQPAYFLPTPQGSPKRPLVVSLHTWSGGYEQPDPLARLVQKEGWAYIHPHFRGPNKKPDACLSENVFADLEDAMHYALTNAHVDAAHIYVVGVSGGGYATLGLYMRTQVDVRLFLSWVPISDLASWYRHSLGRRSNYANDVLKCTSTGRELNEQEARRRSPLHMEGPVRPRHRLEIFAGINDGHTGSVPVSESLNFFNRLATQYGHADRLISAADIEALLERRVERQPETGKIGDRAVLFTRQIPQASVTIFDGGHEMLVAPCFQKIKDSVGETAKPH